MEPRIEPQEGHAPRRPGRAPLRAAAVLAMLTWAAWGGGDAAAQTLTVRVVSDGSEEPVVGALVHVEDRRGALAGRVLTDVSGRAAVQGLTAGLYRVRIEMIGMASAVREGVRVDAGRLSSIDVRIRPLAIAIEGVDVTGDERCRVRPDAGLLAARLWDEVRKALEVNSLTQDRRLHRYETVVYERDMDRDARLVEREDRVRRTAWLERPFESLAVDSLLADGFVQTRGDETLFYGPDADVLLSDPFLDTHCFGVRLDRVADEGLAGLEFRPVPGRRSVPEINGTLWIDLESSELVRLDFRYENVGDAWASPLVGGRVEFRRLPAGSWIIPRWWIRTPRVARQRNARGRDREYVAGIRETGGIVSSVEDASGGRDRGGTGTSGVAGTVLDSLGLRMRGAHVSVIGSSQVVFTDALGSFSITGLLAGTYQLRIVAPALEALGYVTAPLEVEVRAGRLSHVEHSLPSVASAVGELCRPVRAAAVAEEADPGEPDIVGSVVGRVRDARTGEALAGAVVRAGWPRYASAGGGGPFDYRVRQHGFEVRSDANGYYRVCAVPAARIVRLSVAIGDQQWEVGTVRVPVADAVVVRDLAIRR